MKLYYDTRIRDTVVERWANSEITNMNFAESAIPEDQIDSSEAAVFKDFKIPLSFKNRIAQELYNAEEEDIKVAVRSKCQADLLVADIRHVDEEDRLELAQVYER